MFMNLFFPILSRNYSSLSFIEKNDLYITRMFCIIFTL